MPFIPHTPESFLPRSDSKNPNNTCRGITSNGTPCRRAITKTPQGSPASRPSPSTAPSSDSFCWQHQDQAAAHATPTPSPKGHKSGALRERTSVDTLVDRLGLLEVKNERKHRRSTPGSGSAKPSRHNDSSGSPSPPRKPKSSSGFLCCTGSADTEKRAPRPVVHNNGGRTTASVPAQGNSKSSKQPEMYQRPNLNRDPPSRTEEFLALIPKTASPQTTALLLAELAKPVSDQDTEGFIYMFWLTPESMPSDAPAEAAESLLLTPPRPKPGHRRTSDVIDTFSSKTPNAGNKKTMLLKIGRAQNVQRRLQQWTRQCGYNLSLIRYYPYNPSTPNQKDPTQAPKTPRKVPNVNKVERLIHIELNSIRVTGSGKCSSCGREHKEWFEVEASRNGVKAVDEVIRRWADWAERDSKRK